MPATPPPPAAPVPESATTALYRAALGPVNTAQVLRVFERFDEAGRSSPVWNPVAAFLTLNWMVFRQLWGAALVYLVCVVGVLLVAIGFGRALLQQWPPGVVWGTGAALVLLSIAIPGAYGHALLHAEVRRRMTRAVREASTLREACATLARQASGRRRVWVLVALNVMLAGVVAGALLLPGWHALRLSSEPVAGAAGAMTATPVALAQTGVPVASETPPAPEPAAVVDGASEAPAKSDAAATPESVAATPEMTAVDTVAPGPTAAPDAPPPAASGPRPTAPAHQVESRLVPRAAQVARLARPVEGGQQAATPTDAIAPQAHGINVGLFADRANAEKAQARLGDAGFVAILQTVERAGVTLTRVRVGPFAGRAQADEAATRIRALGLDAVVFRP